MSTKYRQAARLREFRRLARRQRDAERQVESVIEARNRLLLDDQEADDKSTTGQLAGALELTENTIRVTLKRLRDGKKRSS